MEIKVVDRMNISGIPTQLKRQFENIATNSGHTTSSYVKQVIKEVIKSYPEELKTKQAIEYEKMNVSGIPVKLKHQFENIARNSGLTTSSFFKCIINETVNLADESMKVKDV